MATAMVGHLMLTHGVFVLAPDAIPPAVGCRSCGRWHYPERVQVAHDGPDGTVPALTLVCPRCHARGPLCVDGPLDPIASAIVAELFRRARPAHLDEELR
jgi:hypothetical protein